MDIPNNNDEDPSNTIIITAEEQDQQDSARFKPSINCSILEDGEEEFETSSTISPLPQGNLLRHSLPPLTSCHTFPPHSRGTTPCLEVNSDCPNYSHREKEAEEEDEVVVNHWLGYQPQSCNRVYPTTTNHQHPHHHCPPPPPPPPQPSVNNEPPSIIMSAPQFSYTRSMEHNMVAPDLISGDLFPTNQEPSIKPHNHQQQHRPRISHVIRAFWDELKALTLELIYYARYKSWKKKVLTVLCCIAACLVFYDLLFVGYIVSWLETFVLWMTNHSIWAVFAFLAIFVLSTIIFVPPTLLLFGSGYAFAQAIGVFPGILAAVFSCFLGSCIGAILAFVRARYMMRDLIYLFAKRYPLVRAADRGLKRNGFRIMLLLRLCPIIPFNGLNYCCGITGVSTHDFVSSLVGILPFQLFTVIVGATAGQLAIGASNDFNNRQQLAWIILICSGIAFGIIALVYTWKTVKTELRKELQMTQEEFDEIIHPTPTALEEQQQDGIESGIEANYMPPDVDEDGGEEWFWVWA